MKFGLKEIAVGTVLALGCSPDNEVQSDVVPTAQQICRARLENLMGALETSPDLCHARNAKNRIAEQSGFLII